MTQDGKNRRSKRRQPEPYEQETVDDLAYAATFAMMGLPVSESTAEHENTMSVDNSNDDEIEIEEEEENVEEKESGKDSGNDHGSSTQEIPENKDVEEDDDDDDDDDDIDLNVAAMEDETDETKDPSGDTNAAPKTKHEVDAYNTPIQELEQHLHFRLTVDNSNTPAKARQLNSSNLICAGKVKHYMMHDRTVVVESNPPVNGASLSPLDEGSLLVLKDISASNNNSLIPLGNIFEVFGPVTQPLYTIRLPAATPSIKDSNSKSAFTKSNQQEGSKTFDDPTTSQSDKEKETDNSTKPQNNKDSKEEEDTTKESPDTANADPEPTTTPRSIDHWAPNGKYSLLLTTSESVPVYFVQDEARLLDTRNIMRKSGKGCGTWSILLFTLLASRESLCVRARTLHIISYTRSFACFRCLQSI
jgi:rRNA processing protein Gar1